MRKQRSILLFLLLSFALLIPCRAVWASPVQFETASVTFRHSGDEEEGWVYITEGSDEIAEAWSTDDDVATVRCDKKYVSIDPMGVGECDAVAKDVNGKTAEVHVKVENSYMADYLKDSTCLYNTWYGTKKIVVDSIPGATGKLKVGNKTFKFTIPKTTKHPTMVKTVNIKKVFKLNTKVICTISMKSNGKKVTTTLKDKLAAGTSVQDAKGKKKTLTLNIFNLHKGDTVKVKYKGRTYTKKITKDKDNKNSKVKFTLKKKLTKNASFTYIIINKDKKQLIKEKLTLTNWKYEYVEPDDSMDDDTDDE